ncbi:MAG TPA: ParB/RepB/Spo0J family partition protein [Candidatus Dormibacteraeota bacterium]|jgi:ParB/RepB/Spo0J family partition protein
MSDSFSAMVAPDQIRVLPGHNARTQLGDVSELAASIAAVGLLQPLTVVELESAPGETSYGLVAGERRLTAVRDLGLDQVPCTVLRGLDERQRTVVMLVENLQRQDLDPIEEAAGFQRLAGLGLSQREIAGQLGCSQSHVSKRLALLNLPDEIRTTIGLAEDSGGITVAEALELTRLADAPARLANAFEQGRRGHFGGIAGTVRDELAAIERERAVAEARSRLTSDGVEILEQETHYSWYGRQEKPLRGCGHDYEAIPLTVGQHQAEPCHAAAIERDGKVVYVCREPTRHGIPDAAARLKAQQRRQREEGRELREAAARRREAIATVLAAANTSRLPFAARQVISGWRVDDCKLACHLLELPPKPGRYSPSYTEALAEYAARNMGAAIKAVLALALAGGELIVGGTWGGVSERSQRHMELLVTAGYQPCDVDRKHLDGPEADGEDSEVPTCRVCGCTTEEACPGGCTWVEDPAGLGDLCSRCLAGERVDLEADGLVAEESA